MGCASSKEKRCLNCNIPYSSVPRSYSVREPSRGGLREDYHVVTLTSSTLGSIRINSSLPNIHIANDINFNGDAHARKKDLSAGITEAKTWSTMINEKIPKALPKLPQTPTQTPQIDIISDDHSGKEEFSMGLIEAKTWSNMINEKIPKISPKTPTRTPPGEPETINAWELMEGLEDISPHRSPNHFRSFSFDVRRCPTSDHLDLTPKVKVQENDNDKASLRPMWLQMSKDDDQSNSSSMILQFDPVVISSFRKSLEELSPDNPFYIRPLENVKPNGDSDLPVDVVAKKINNNIVKDYDPPPQTNNVLKHKDTIVLYFTSLRGIRKTYEDCCHVKLILKSIGVRVDERDTSMHSRFKEELIDLLGAELRGKPLPRVFAGGKYIGGAEEIRRMHEDGELEKMLDSCEKLDDVGTGTCEACGDVRFVPCETCNGSCKVYFEEEEVEEGEFGFQRCSECNENGLIRCPICCY